MIKSDIARTTKFIKGNLIKKIIGCMRSPGVHAVVILRFGQWLKLKNIAVRALLEPVYFILFHRIRSKWGIEIPRSAKLGEGLYIGHHGGIFISGSAVVGKNANLAQQVTIGVSGKGINKGVPTIGDNVYIGPGAKIFGKIIIGDNVTIGANAVVYKDIPDNAVVVLNPGFEILSYKKENKLYESHT